MTRSASIVLNDHLADFIEEQLGNGSYQSASEVVEAGLELLEERQARLKVLTDALIEGEKGPFRPFDPDSFLEEMHRKYVR